jgi:hypothetical protein
LLLWIFFANFLFFCVGVESERSNDRLPHHQNTIQPPPTHQKLRDKVANVVRNKPKYCKVLPKGTLGAGNSAA